MNRIGFRILNLHSASFKSDRCVPLCFKNTHLNFSLYSQAVLFQTLRKLKYAACVKLNTVFNQRNCSSNSDQNGKKNKSIPLMNFNPVLKPEIMLTIKNWILTKIIIQPYLDSHFTMKDFTFGAKQAIAAVSSFLSQGDFQSLKGLVTDEAIQEIKSNFVSLNVKERQDLRIKMTDILFAFPYQIGIFFDDANQKRFAEITVVYHCVDDFEENGQGKLLDMENAKDDLKICNYRFIREYTKGVQSDWTINRLGHFKLRDFQN